MIGNADDQDSSSHATLPIEVLGRVSGRRRWTVEQKLAIMRDAFGMGELTGTKRMAVAAFAGVEVWEPLLPAVAASAQARRQIAIALIGERRGTLSGGHFAS